MKIKFYLAARKQLEDIHDFIARDSKVNAAKVYNGILDEIERLAALPQIARTEDALGGLGLSSARW
ncbi:MAG: type II toxin-antitoxin system RelE/ParE family toxin [Proteiniphilum sp.]|jgi:plasmid stabilization system protein ParE|nr:type II toxin-antitoxin system RelE/ParE family toxin [Proteiniphilum sp.]